MAVLLVEETGVPIEKPLTCCKAGKERPGMDQEGMKVAGMEQSGMD